MKVTREVDQALEVAVKPIGNGAHAVLPASWRDRRVLVLLLPEAKE